jgi:hypothetical protein
LAAGVYLALLLVFPSVARGEFCWMYSRTSSLAPISCVQVGNTTQTCSSGDPNGGLSCHDDGTTNLGNCCTTLPAAPNSETVEQQHEDWHACFGPTGNQCLPPATLTGGTTPNPFAGRISPPGRGARWYAFHRQLTLDFDIFRGAAPNGPASALRIEWVPWGRDAMGNPKHLFHDFPSTSPTDTAATTPCADPPNPVWRRGNELDPAAGVGLGGPPCDTCVEYPECLNFRPGQQTSTGICTEAGISYRRDATGRVAVCAPLCSNPSTSPCRYFDDGSAADISMLTELTSLDQFTDVEQVTDLMDSYFHGQMHVAVGQTGSGHCSLPPYATCTTDSNCPSIGPCTSGHTCTGTLSGTQVSCNQDADCGVCMSGGHQYCQDVLGTAHSVRDPEFWRLHKSLDTAVQAWQRTKPVDIVIVLDISGSMLQQDSNGTTKYARAAEAAAMFADALSGAAAGGSPQSASNIGIIVYSNGTSRVLPLTPANTITAASVTALLNAITPAGCTAIGSALIEASHMLCGAQGCANRGDRRRGVLLLTDGIENVPPCLFDDSASGSTGTCGVTCNGSSDGIYDQLGDTQVCAVGFGETAQISGDKLTLLAEREGGIYYHQPSQNPPGPTQGTFRDLKVIFAKCFGLISQDAELLDPTGTLPPNQLAADPVTFNLCSETSNTVIAGWDKPVDPGGLRLEVTSPTGELVRSDQSPAVQSLQKTWTYSRMPLPYKGEQSGEWRAQLIRPHSTYVNGFTTDSLPADVSVPLVRREIQRVCPQGCAQVLYFEDGHLGASSSYDTALAAEVASGLIGSRTTAANATDFSVKLAGGPWDLVVYAHQLTQAAEPYDMQLQGLICGTGQRIILTDTRTTLPGGLQINNCAGASMNNPPLNWTTLTGDGRLLDGTHTLTNPGYSTFSYGFFAAEESSLDVQATNGTTNENGAIGALPDFTVNSQLFGTVSWFTEVTFQGDSLLQAHKPEFLVRTTQGGLLPSVQISPHFVPKGGYDSVVATVTVDSPTIGTGAFLLAHGLASTTTGGETTSGRAGGLETASIPMVTSGPYTLNDDGVNGDQHPHNFYWTAKIPSLGQIDGMYKYRFDMKLTKNGCTTQRSLTQSVFVDVGVDPASSPTKSTPGPNGSQTVTITPQDPFGNPWGPGKTPPISCGPPAECTCSQSDIVDNGDGSYTVTVHKQPGSVADCTIIGWGTTVPICASDKTPPVFQALPPVTDTLCDPSSQVATLATPTATDVCSPTVSVTGEVVSSNGVPLATPIPIQNGGAVLAPGVYGVQWTAKDQSGNVATTTQTLTVRPAIETSQSFALEEKSRVVLATSGGFAMLGNTGSGSADVQSEVQTGSVLSQGPVTLEDGVVVHGDVESGSTVRANPAATVTGQITSNASFVLPPGRDLSGVVFPAANSGAIDVDRHQSQTPAPGAYSTVDVAREGTLFLTAGTYFFESLHLHEGSRVNLDQSAGPVRVYVHQSMTYKGQIASIAGNPGDFVLGYAGSRPLGIHTRFLGGTLIAPNAPVSISSREHEAFTGEISAESIHLEEHRTLVCDPVGLSAQQAGVPLASGATDDETGTESMPLEGASRAAGTSGGCNVGIGAPSETSWAWEIGGLFVATAAWRARRRRTQTTHADVG